MADRRPRRPDFPVHVAGFALTLKASGGDAPLRRKGCMRFHHASILWPLLGSLLLGASACVGQIGPTGEPKTAPHEPPAGDASSPAQTACTTRAGIGVGPTPLRRLTRREYRNTITDLFGVAAPSDADLPDDGADANGFTTTTSQPLNPAGALKYFDVATAVGERLITQLPTLFPCAPGADEASCVTTFLDTTGTRLFRRPLTVEEKATFAQVFAKARAGDAPFADAAIALVQTLLVSPQFLFIIEPTAGDGSRPRPLDSWQMATRLSYLLWQTTPDSVLMEAAAQDQLRTPASIAVHVRRMLDSPRARPAVAAFFDDWLSLRDIENVQKDTTVFPHVTPQVLGALAQESRHFVEDLFWNQNGRLDRLLLSPTRVRSHLLSRYYGDDLGQTDAAQTLTAPIDEKSFGLLSQAGFLMAISRNDGDAIIFRGKFIRTRLLCQPIFLPPPGLATPLPSIQDGVTSRERLEMHTSAGACAGCHSQMNPFGYALEHFDAAGQWRDSERGLAIDAAAEVDASDLGRFDGARDLSNKLATSAMVRQCVVSQVFQYALRRQPTDEDRCALEALEKSFIDSQLSIRALLTNIALSDAFFARVEPKN